MKLILLFTLAILLVSCGTPKLKECVLTEEQISELISESFVQGCSFGCFDRTDTVRFYITGQDANMFKHIDCDNFCRKVNISNIKVQEEGLE